MAVREKPRGGSQQRELFARSQDAIVNLDPNHRVVRMADEIDCTALLALVQRIRRQKLKNAAGRPPRLRALTGAVIFRSQRRIPYREAEDQIRHYAPARYLCGLTETSWSPDANTIQDFEQLLGEERDPRSIPRPVRRPADLGRRSRPRGVLIEDVAVQSRA